jgi:tetratricopeptide (TPR) repeat protein
MNRLSSILNNGAKTFAGKGISKRAKLLAIILTVLVLSAVVVSLVYLYLELFKEEVTISQVNSDEQEAFHDWMLKAGACQTDDRTDSAIYYYSLALKSAERLNNRSFVARTKNGIANCYLRKEDYSKAIVYLTEALREAQLSGEKHCEGLINNGLGLVNISLNKPGEAIEYFKKAETMCRETGDLQNAAGISLNIANCYVEQDDFVRAHDFYERNLSTLKEINDTSQIILAYTNLATVSRLMNDTESSINNLERALGYLELHPNSSLKSTALMEKGNTYIAMGNLTQAKKYILESLSISHMTLAKSNSMEALLRLSEIAEKEKDYLQALTLHKKYDLIKDSVMNDETRRSISEIRLKADVQKKEYDNRLLSDKIVAQKKKSMALGILSVMIILIVLLTTVLIWLSLKTLRKSYKLQELANINLQEKIRSDELLNKLELMKYEAELESRNKELTSVSFQLVNKNKILTDLSVISGKYYNSGKMDGPTYNNFQRIVNENLNSDKEWNNFKELFEKVHTGFFTGLKDQFPELSENELRLCAYLRINLQNKEIARILNVSPPTVVTSRYRIRKKMKLENKIVLEDYLRGF